MGRWDGRAVNAAGPTTQANLLTTFPERKGIQARYRQD